MSTIRLDLTCCCGAELHYTGGEDENTRLANEREAFDVAHEVCRNRVPVPPPLPISPSYPVGPAYPPYPVPVWHPTITCERTTTTNTADLRKAPETEAS